MSYKILPTQEFSKDFKKVDKQFQDRIKNKIEEVAARIILHNLKVILLRLFHVSRAER